MAPISRKCIECGEKKTKKAKGRDFYLCEKCMELDKYKVLCMTHIKNQYFVTEDELFAYDYHIARQGRGYPDMILYNINDVKDVFCSKYGIDREDDNAITDKMNSLREEKEKKSRERKEKIKQKKEEKKNKKRNNLSNALKEYGLTLRNDSKLCNGFIDGTITDWSINEIVHRMCQMKYLYDYCDMNSCYQKAYEDQRDELKAGYFPDCTVFEQAEMIALDEHGGYPEVWPWLT